MGFSSALYRDEIIINDETREDLYMPRNDEDGRGLRLEFRGSTDDYAYEGVAAPFPKSLEIDPSEFQARIQEMEETKSRISDLIRLKNLPHKDQASTNYCWINAPVHCLEINRLQQNNKVVSLSPASGGALIKNFQNRGGWGKEAVIHIAEKGVNDITDWPANAIDRKYATAQNAQKALSFRVDEWIECRPRNVNQMISCLLHRLPGAGGYNWWGHEVTDVDPVWLDGTVAVRIRNSWRNWGDFGFGILQGSKMLADDLVFLLNARPAF